MIEFTPSYARLSPKDWIDLTLMPIGARTVCVGPDFRFGHHCAGDVALLEACGFEVRIAPRINGASSTTIRRLLSEGRTGEAERLMRPRACVTALSG